jgi:hypothetical protein
VGRVLVDMPLLFATLTAIPPGPCVSISCSGKAHDELNGNGMRVRRARFQVRQHQFNLTLVW